MASSTRAFPYEARTRGVIVRVLPTYLADQSDPGRGRWVWAYAVEIENEGLATVQLISRHWVITDARGHVEEVRGPGVVGEQPVLAPGQTHRYVSGCPLTTDSGMMEGTFQMIAEGGTTFDAAIPAFALERPDAARTLN